jgi:two-component system response regulator HydG
MARLLGDQLRDVDYAVELAHTGEDAISALRARPFDAVVTDLRMERTDGHDVLAAAHALDPHLPVIIMTAFGALESAIEAMRRGAYHYLTKPFPLAELLLYLERALAERRLRDQHRALQREAAARLPLFGMIGETPVMRALFDLVERVAASDAPVLIRGESGTGKELVARALHARSARQGGAFVAVNCSALPETLLESELFGHVRGAFTGATAPRRGLFVEADGGTLFLDEIGDLPMSLQPKLLRVLEDQEIRAVGSDVPRRVNVRVLCATHRDIEERVRQDLFRQDLFYRLNVVPLEVPPLRARVLDIPELARHFLTKAKERNPRSRLATFAETTLDAFVRYPWPGNVRELEHLIERLAIMTPFEILDASHLPASFTTPDRAPHPAPWDQGPMRTLRQVEDAYVTWVLARCDGNKTRAAEILGIDVSTLHRREKRGLQ